MQEWIELYNSNNFDVDLSGWHLQDQQGTITTFTIPSGVKILANNFLVFKRPDTKIMLNNDTDGLNLLTPDEKTEDTMSFTTAPLNQSYNKTNSGWVWSSTLTPGTTNIITAVQSATQAKNNSATLSKTQKNDNNKITTAATADLSQTINTNQDDAQNNSPWILFFAALAITIILSSIVLFIKLKFKKNVGT
ncbi:MAG: lamin tail domain-containing protein [Candidatus Staskawiczbacteria bacterium]|jgi:hypothetical protein